MSKLSDKQIATAKALMKKHSKDVVYMIAETGSMYFGKHNAEITAKGKEIVTVKADAVRPEAKGLVAEETKPKGAENTPTAAAGEEAAAERPKETKKK